MNRLAKGVAEATFGGALLVGGIVGYAVASGFHDARVAACAHTDGGDPDAYRNCKAHADTVMNLNGLFFSIDMVGVAAGVMGVSKALQARPRA